jgi:hypothetical protein
MTGIMSDNTVKLSKIKLKSDLSKPQCGHTALLTGK